MNARPLAIVLSGEGINAERELAEGLELAGALARVIHLADLEADVSVMLQARIIAFPGGFSYGDHIASGRVLALRVRTRLGETLREAVSRGCLVLGICNGFQVLVKMGLLPSIHGIAAIGAPWSQEATLTYNVSGRFEDRWCPMKFDSASPCVWTCGLDRLELPVRHGEGRLVFAPGVLDRIRERGLAPLRYASSEYPVNPNGSQDNIAGLCDPSGRVFGLMPHPEVFLHGFQHPRWTRGSLAPDAPGGGLAILRNGVLSV